MLEHQDRKTQEIRAGFAIALDCQESDWMETGNCPEVVSTIELTV
ncbi:hypothetical protein [Laspinema sp. D2d]|nr:hypothetical protein [Laspinema sp. D2d]